VEAGRVRCAGIAEHESDPFSPEAIDDRLRACDQGFSVLSGSWGRNRKDPPPPPLYTVCVPPKLAGGRSRGSSCRNQPEPRCGPVSPGRSKSLPCSVSATRQPAGSAALPGQISRSTSMISPGFNFCASSWACQGWCSVERLVSSLRCDTRSQPCDTGAFGSTAEKNVT